MLICAAIIRLITTCVGVWLDTHTSETAEDGQHLLLVEMQVSLGDAIAQDMANFVSISLAIIGGATMRNGKRDEKITRIT